MVGYTPAIKSDNLSTFVRYVLLIKSLAHPLLRRVKKEFNHNMDENISILSVLVSAVVIYLIAYLKFKAKNRALIEDVVRLEDEKHKIIAKYRAETEELKKRHTLDIEKKKYQYEDKRVQFAKYFALLDEFNGKCNSVFAEKFQPIMVEFLSKHLVDDKEAQHQSRIQYNESVHKIFFELNAEHLKLQTETNSIRLISSPQIDLFLNALESNVKLATDQAMELLQFMTTDEFWVDQSASAPHQEKMAISGKNILDCRKNLRDQMKAELDEI